MSDEDTSSEVVLDFEPYLSAIMGLDVITPQLDGASHSFSHGYNRLAVPEAQIVRVNGSWMCTDRLGQSVTISGTLAQKLVHIAQDGQDVYTSRRYTRVHTPA